MTKVLNLDSFEQTTDKIVHLNGVDHKFVPFTVDQFIAQVKEIEEIEKAGAMSMADYANYSKKTILRAFPSIKEEDLGALPLNKLKALTDFVRSVAEEETAAGVAQDTASGNGEGEAAVA